MRGAPKILTPAFSHVRPGALQPRAMCGLRCIGRVSGVGKLLDSPPAGRFYLRYRGREDPGNRQGGVPVATAHVEERELLQAMTWYDGFVVALANPSFLITSLGLSVLSLGGWGAIIVWGISILAGGLHNNIYAEVAAMVPKL